MTQRVEREADPKELRECKWCKGFYNVNLFRMGKKGTIINRVCRLCRSRYAKEQYHIKKHQRLFDQGPTKKEKIIKKIIEENKPPPTETHLSSSSDDDDSKSRTSAAASEIFIKKDSLNLIKREDNKIKEIEEAALEAELREKRRRLI